MSVQCVNSYLRPLKDFEYVYSLDTSKKGHVHEINVDAGIFLLFCLPNDFKIYVSCKLVKGGMKMGVTIFFAGTRHAYM